MRITPKEKNTLALGLLLVMLLVFLRFAQPEITGYAVYEQQAASFSFDNPNDYIYDNNLIEIGNGDVKLKLQTTATTRTDAITTKLNYSSLDKIAVTNLNPANYQTALLKEGDKYYISGNKKINTLPDELKGLLWIKTKNDDKNEEVNVSFDVDRDATVYIGYDKRDTAPDWLSQWDFWGEGIETTVEKGTPFNIYRKEFEAGNVLLGSSNNSKSMYVVLINGTVYESSKEIVSEAHNHSGKLSKIEWNAETPSGTSVKVRVREAATEEEREDAAWSSYYTESGSNVDGQISDGYAQYGALLETADNSETPVLKSVTVTFEKEEYPSSAQIETQDLTVAKASSWGNLITLEELNGQAINYYYSVDSGNSWNLLSDYDLSSAPVANKKIRIRAELNSDKTQTPELSEIMVNYTFVVCEEEWEARNSECGTDDRRIKYYSDVNSCGTSDGIPADNGTIESCNYCTPSWESINGSCRENDAKEINYYYNDNCCGETGLASDCTILQNTSGSCDYCTPLWSCAGYGECQVNGEKQCTSVADANNCYSATNLDSDAYTGDYSEFTASCAYDSSAPLIAETEVNPKAVNLGEEIEITANISDESSVTATAHLRNEKGLIVNKSLSESNESSGAFSAKINTSALERGAYLIGIAAVDAKGNKALKEDSAMVVIAAKDATVEKVTLSETTPYQLNTTNKTASLKIFSRPTEGQISVVAYYSDFRNTTKPAKEVGRYLDIVAEEKVANNITNSTLRIYYTDEELADSNINETSIRIYFYNETSGWEALSTAVNKDENYAEAPIEHYSTYGIFGEENAEIALNDTINDAINAAVNDTTAESMEEAETVSSGGGGVKQVEGNKTEETGVKSGDESEKKEVEETGEEKCFYDVSIGLPARIALTHDNLPATITNTGTCGIEVLELEITGEASRFISVTPAKIERLGIGMAAEFNLTKIKDAGTPLQGLLVAEQKTKTYKGELKVQGLTGSLIGLEETLAINVEVMEDENRIVNLKTGSLFILAAIMLLAIALAKRKRRTKKEAEQVEQIENF